MVYMSLIIDEKYIGFYTLQARCLFPEEEEVADERDIAMHGDVKVTHTHTH